MSEQIEKAVTSENQDKVKDTNSQTDLAGRDDALKIGATVRVFYRIIEAGKERIQPYEGVVIAKKGSGVSKTFTVRRLGADQVGVERIFPVFSPRITDIQVIRLGKVRRAKLYYLRNRLGRKESKLKEKVVSTTSK